MHFKLCSTVSSQLYIIHAAINIWNTLPTVATLYTHLYYYTNMHVTPSIVILLLVSSALYISCAILCILCFCINIIVNEKKTSAQIRLGRSNKYICVDLIRFYEIFLLLVVFSISNEIFFNSIFFLLHHSFLPS